MKKSIFILAAFLTFNLFAQQPGGRGGRPQSQNKQGEIKLTPKEFNSSEVAGIFYYDTEEVIQKIKVKNKDTQFLVKKSIQNYNTKIKEISFLNSQKFSELNLVVSSSIQTQDPEEKSELRIKIEEVIRPIRGEVSKNEKELNESFKNILSEKHLKKWMKYQKQQKESLQPKQSQNKQRQPSLQGGGRGRQ